MPEANKKVIVCPLSEATAKILAFLKKIERSHQIASFNALVEPLNQEIIREGLTAHYPVMITISVEAISHNQVAMNLSTKE
jgi:hypothetical protein